jgi:ATP-dependent Lon protease
MLEQLAGVLYIAMVVARMVGLTFARVSMGGGRDESAARGEPTSNG